jgi:hypothetical protein
MVAALQLSWFDDLRAESELRRMAITFEKVRIKFTQIDLVESQHNGARLHEVIVEHKVEDYMQGFRNGDTFPSIIVHKTPKGHVILSGNQRGESIRRLIKEGDLPKDVEIEVYVVDTKDKLLLDIIARTGNVAHGEGSPKEERIQQAVYSVRNRGLSSRDAARLFVVSATSIMGHIRAEDIRARLQRAGVDAHQIANSALIPLSALDHDESTQVKVGALAAQHQCTAETVKQVVGTITKQTSQPARVARVKEWEKALATDAHSINGKSHAVIENSKVPKRPRRDKFFGQLTRLVNFLESDNAGEAFTRLDELQVTTQAEQERAATLVKKLRYRLGVLVK